MNELARMRTFVAVADAGSFTAAARTLSTRQPTVSRRVSELEQALGVALLVRTTRSLALTEAGLRYLERAREALDAVELAREAAQGEGALEGRVRITAPVSFTEAWLTEVLPDFLTAHPQLDVHLELTERHVDLVAEGIDAGVRVGGPDTSNLRGRRLGRVERWFVCSPAHLLENGPIDTLDDLRERTGLIFGTTGTRPSGWTIDGEEITPARRLVATNGQPLLRFAREGLGVGLLPNWLVRGAVERGELVQVLTDARVATLDLWVVWPTHRYPRAATRAFVAWIEEQARAHF